VGWIKKLEPTTTLYSYVMNNYWETNYKASQSGEHTFRYYIRPHKKYKAGEATRFAVGKGQPLLAVPCERDQESRKSMLSIRPLDVVATALKPADEGEGLVLRLFNASDKKERARVELSDSLPGTIRLSDLKEQPLSPVGRSIDMAPWEIVTLRISED
jgi:alpha-mannosidase